MEALVIAQQAPTVMMVLIHPYQPQANLLIQRPVVALEAEIVLAETVVVEVAAVLTFHLP
jgi:hypothetical protein